MTAGAIALGGIIEKRQTQLLLRAQRGLTPEKGVVLAAEGMELRVLGFERGHSRADALQASFRIVQYRYAIQGLEICQVRAGLEFGNHRGRIGVGHLDRVEKRLRGLVGQTGGAPITEEAAIGATLGIKEEARRAGKVGERRRIAESAGSHADPANGHRQTMIRSRGIGRKRKFSHVACGTGLLA